MSLVQRCPVHPSYDGNGLPHNMQCVDCREVYKAVEVRKPKVMTPEEALRNLKYAVDRLPDMVEGFSSFYENDEKIAGYEALKLISSLVLN